MLKNEEWFKQLFNNSGVGILIVDKNRKILEVNLSLCETFGYSYEELIGKSAQYLHISKESYENFAKIGFNKVLNHSSLNLEYLFKKKDGTHFWIKIAGDAISSKQEVLWTLIDISERIKAEEEVKQLNLNLNWKIGTQVKKLREKDRQLQYQARLAQMGEILSMIAHQWRQPLTAICATSSYLYGKTLIEDINKKEFQEELSNIENYTKLLSNTIDDFRTFFKPKKKKELTSLEEIIDGTLKIIEPILTTHNIKIEKIYNCNIKLNTLKNELKQVVLNILKNSEDAFIDKTLTNKTIQIITFENEEYLCLEIKDNAGGIQDEHLNQVFNSYFTTKPEEDGTGLGLCMSKTIIENNCKGKITARNENNGAVFQICLPKIRQLMDN